MGSAASQRAPRHASALLPFTPSRRAHERADRQSGGVRPHYLVRVLDPGQRGAPDGALPWARRPHREHHDTPPLSSPSRPAAEPTSAPTDSQVEYGPTTSYGSSTPVNAALLTAHSHGLGGLTESTTTRLRSPPLHAQPPSPRARRPTVRWSTAPLPRTGPRPRSTRRS